MNVQTSRGTPIFNIKQVFNKFYFFNDGQIYQTLANNN